MPKHAPHVAAAFYAAALLRTQLIQSAQRTVQVMGKIATAREQAAAGYRRMARQGGPRATRYLQHAERLDHSAARARRFAERELEQITQWQRENAIGD